jgi:hypothetical protein
MRVFVHRAEFIAYGPIGYGAERGHLEYLGTRVYVDEPESPSYDASGPEYSLDPRRLSVGDDIEILGPAAEQQIPHGSAHDIGLVPVLAKAFYYAESVRINACAFDPVFRLGVNDGLGNWFAVFRSAVADEQCGASP